MTNRSVQLTNRTKQKAKRCFMQKKLSTKGLLALVFFALFCLLGSSYLGLFDSSATTVKLLEPAFSKKANHYLAKENPSKQLSLILQTDKRWGQKSYGQESKNNDLAHNGCALVSLAMIHSFWEKRPVNPTEILQWAKNDYYVSEQGTSWQIFADFASKNDYQFENIGNYYNRASQLMNQGIPIIVSVKKGTFTTSGHIMVLYKNETGALKVYDPNDSPSKKHYQKTYPSETLINEGLNYWALWKA